MNIHLLKLMWNRRRDYVWIFIEQLLVFVVLFYCFTQIYSKLEQYFDPGNLDSENVYALAIIPDEQEFETDDDWDEFQGKRNNIMNKMQNSPYVETVHRGNNTIPGNRPAWNNAKDSLEYKGRKYPFYLKTSDGNFQKIFRIKMLEGVWFKDEALEDGTYPVILTKTLVEKMELSEPVGVKFTYLGRDFKIVGVINDYKSFLFDDTMPSAILAMSAFGGENYRLSRDIETAIRVKDGLGTDFANFFWKEAQRVFPNTSHQFLISDIGKSRNGEKLGATISLLISIIPTFFLAVFAFLGTFSLMYRQVMKNHSEYGLRMAIGSTRANLKSMILCQSLFLTSIATLLGVVVSINIYLFVFQEVRFAIILESIFCAFGLMLLFACISVYYPAYSASKIQPVTALKQEE